MKRTGFKPHDLATIQLPTSKRRRTVEVISYPFPAGASSGQPCDGQIIDSVKVRMVPGEPTTLDEVRVADLQPRAKERYCHIAEVDCRGTVFSDIGCG